MYNVLNYSLFISTLLSGIVWFFFKINFIKNYFYNKKKKINIDFSKVKKNKTCFYKSISSFFPMLLTIFIIRSFIYEPFQIPSGSMMPTLLIGDFILVEKFSYGIKEPITQKILMHTNSPKRGDIVVFRHPKNNMYYIKRIIGLPGDKVTYNIDEKNIKVCINYIKEKNCQKKIFIQHSRKKLSNFFQKIYFFYTPEQKKIYNSIFFKIAKEDIHGLKHDILLLDKKINNLNNYYKQKNMPKLTWLVPLGEYFMMGDNRDNSSDSRYWGFVPEKNLLGKATKIWMSFEKEENKWPTNIRFNRIGNIY